MMSDRRAIIDIGSNSIRLVVFGGAPRAPVVLYNEKIMAGLGRGVVQGGRLDPATAAIALAGLQRFSALLDGMDLASLRVVATAAVREAADGEAFIEAVRALGLPAEILSGEDEAVGSGQGVLAAMPGADGLVADMGGGSLELVRVAGDAVLQRTSLRLGTMRVAEIRASGHGKLRRHVQTVLGKLAWLDNCAGRPLYLVGGAWRALARVHMQQTGAPLSVLGNYAIPPEDARALYDSVRAMDRLALKALPGIKSARIAHIDDGAGLLSALVEALRPSALVISAQGLREGLLHQALPPEQRARDPLIEGVRFVTANQQQFPGYAEALDAWLGGLFGTEAPTLARLRLSACLLRGTGWSSNPDFRALGAEELALHGNWTGASPADRAIMAASLLVAMGGIGGGTEQPALLTQLAGEDDLRRARGWGYAMRLAQRISGGAPALLLRTAIRAEGGQLVLELPRDLHALVDTTLERRLTGLANAFELAAPRIDLVSSPPDSSPTVNSMA
ncbi:Ppx/GppA family phosphatase [Novosphingobium sp.]|uniref:Ppx/GppA family phosphatase n=1 Tax=Novosphingobium sp. TaxID=1874826 RepID=UPI0025F92D80|nr:Ppx/GppA family phosphatase [Novosphingobium sp.]